MQHIAYIYADDAAGKNLALPCPHRNGNADAFDVFDVTLKHTLAWIADWRMALFLRTITDLVLCTALGGHMARPDE
jgi:hypothetical protein